MEKTFAFILISWYKNNIVKAFDNRPDENFTVLRKFRKLVKELRKGKSLKIPGKENTEIYLFYNNFFFFFTVKLQIL